MKASDTLGWNGLLARIAFGIAILLAGSQALAGTASGTAANHIMSSSTHVTYGDLGSGTYSADASVTITVELIPAAPDAVFDAADSDSLSSVAPGQTVNLVYTITSNSNGPDNYTLSGTATNTSASSTGNPAPQAFDLGATTVANASPIVAFETTDVSAGAGTQITVPADNIGGDSLLNGLSVGDVVVLNMTTGGDNVCTVNQITEPTLGSEANATSTLEVDNCSQGSGSLELGDQIGQRVNETLQVTVSASTTAGTIDVDASADYTGGSAPTIVATQSITVVLPNVTIYKFVRNVTTPSTPSQDNAGPGEILNLNTPAVSFYKKGVTAKPGEELEYAIVLINSGTDATSVTVTDPLALFTTYVGIGGTTASNIGDGDGVRIYEDVPLDSIGCDSGASSNTCQVSTGGPGAITEATDDDITGGGDIGGNNGGTITAYPGTGASEPVGGTIGAGKVAIVIYDVTVD